MALSDAQVQNRCLCWQGAATCRYLEQDKKNWRKYNCLRQLVGRKAAIDKKVAAHITSCKQQRIDPAHAFTPIGDGAGCLGYPYLPKVKQGYDVKKP